MMFWNKKEPVKEEIKEEKVVYDVYMRIYFKGMRLERWDSCVRTNKKPDNIIDCHRECYEWFVESSSNDKFTLIRGDTVIVLDKKDIITMDFSSVEVTIN